MSRLLMMRWRHSYNFIMDFSINNLKTHISILLKSEIARLFPSSFCNLKFYRHLAVIIITHRCNLKCIMCGEWRQAPGIELAAKDWYSVFLQLKELGITDIHFTGGEPLVRDDLCDLVKYAAGLKCSVGVTTNGCLLTEKLLNDLAASGLNSIAVSLDATDKDYEDIRGREGSFSKVSEALSLISRYNAKGRLKGYVNFVLMKPSLSHFYNVKKLCDSLNLPVAICLLDDMPYFFNIKENQTEFWLGKESERQLDAFIDFLRIEQRKNRRSLIISAAAINYIKGYFQTPAQKQIPCIASQTRVFINPSGKVKGGCLSLGEFGDLRDSSLREILTNGRLRALQRDMFYKRCPGCSCGYLYNLQHHLPSLLTGY